MSRTDADTVDALLTHAVETVADKEHLRARLLAGEKLRVKLGVDPTAPDLHLGHAVLLRKLRAFQDQGHTVVFIVGDATARIGDPSGRSKMRPPLSDEEIAQHAKTYLAQVGAILDVGAAEVRSNSEWLDRLSLSALLALLQKFTIARVLERDDFQQRLRARTPIGLHELLYPVLQAYDSVAVRADVEIGGSDQTFNLLFGRDLQPHFQQPAQDVLTTSLLVGLDGKEKMSKSLKNAVGITEPPGDMFGKLMTIPDTALPGYARLAAGWPEKKVTELPRRFAKENPRDVKAEVARDIVALYHGAEAAKRAAEEWLRVFHDKKLPANIGETNLELKEWDIAELLVAAGLAPSKSEARRLVDQGGVQHNETPVPAGTKTLTIAKGDLLQVGKRKFVRVG
ncbi:MAG: tyrosyl-tRNA synthetase [Parcubacteria group bacterium Gr01-1014_106]|nr:MAG: tyrosyl-tRNA synthetase [Parcubacteria group bacterium Gr01-1014_106]